MQRVLFLLPLALALKPHIFMMVVDDFGWANFGPHRTPADDPTGEVQTPTMSALAAAGVLLNRNYLFWYCSPSRSALQSGRNPIHVNLNNDDLFLSNPVERTTGGFSGIPRNMTCIGNKMQTAGYETSFFGKWHVGMATNDHAPAGRGWEHHLIYFDGANDYWTSSEGNCGRAAMTDLWLNSAPAKGLNNSYSCSQAHQPASCVYEDAMFLQQTLDAIKGRDTSRPYFQIWAPHNIHAPLQVPAAYLSNFSFIADPNRQAYAAKVRYIDDALAQVVAALKAAGMWENTLFVLSADNGGPVYDDGSAGANNWPLKGGKTSNWEGGVRGNGLVSGGFLPAARRGVQEEGFVAIEDWYATFCGLAGVPVDDPRAAAAGLPQPDSVDQWPLISGANSTPPRTEVVLGQPTVSGANSIGDPYMGVQALIRADGYKLILGTTHQNVWTSPAYPNKSSTWKNDPYDCGGKGGCLFNVFTDPTEHLDVAAAHPDIVASMRARIAELNATLYNPNRGKSDQAGACSKGMGDYGGFWGPWL